MRGEEGAAGIKSVGDEQGDDTRVGQGGGKGRRKLQHMSNVAEEEQGPAEDEADTGRASVESAGMRSNQSDDAVYAGVDGAAGRRDGGGGQVGGDAAHNSNGRARREKPGEAVSLHGKSSKGQGERSKGRPLDIVEGRLLDEGGGVPNGREEGTEGRGGGV